MDPAFRLPPDYVLNEEQPDMLVLRRADRTVVERFFLSVVGPDPRAMQNVAEADYRMSAGSGGR